MLLDGVCTVNICDVHHIEKKRVYYEIRIHRRNLVEYKGAKPESKRMKTNCSDVDYDSAASVSVSQTDSEYSQDTESDSESEFSFESSV
jgi:hypothetical protein